MPKFIVETACQFQHRVYRQGEMAEIDAADIIPCDFCDGKGKKDGAECPKCHGTKSMVPPYHFREIETARPAMAAEEGPKDLTEEERIEELRAQITELGGGYDHRWKLKKLEQALVEIKKKTGN